MPNIGIIFHIVAACVPLRNTYFAAISTFRRSQVFLGVIIFSSPAPPCQYMCRVTPWDMNKLQLQ